jgi:hypothetical protein
MSYDEKGELEVIFDLPGHRLNRGSNHFRGRIRRNKVGVTKIMWKMNTAVLVSKISPN